jgi:hypothetical protein
MGKEKVNRQRRGVAHTFFDSNMEGIETGASSRK